MTTLEQKLKNIPNSPGIYQYFDKDGRVLYIGKAKVLKNRVKSYFNFTPTISPNPKLSPRIFKMLTEVENLEYIVVESEQDALILENSLIKQLKPKYNILLRDDKTYPYIYIDLSEEFPRFEITRKVIKRPYIRYFGPFASGAKDIVNSIYELFPLVQRKANIKSQKRCLFYQIKRCLAPCEGLVSKKEYRKIVDDAFSYIADSKKVIKKLEEKMLILAEELKFEEAGKLRDRIKKIKKASVLITIDIAKLENFDIFAVEVEEERACGVKIFVRDGKVVSSDHHIFKNEFGFDRDELYKTLLLNHYQKELPFIPKEILLNDEFSQKDEIERFIYLTYGKKVEIKIPQKGDKKKLTILAQKNAKELLRVQSIKNQNILKEIKELFGLSCIPYAIEGYDNSHMMGSARVGSVVFWEEKFIKQNYRHYNLSSSDEYAQMKELLKRRIENLEKNPLPNLLVIDGGKTLLDLAIKIAKQKNIFVDIVAIAKEKRDAKVQRAKGRAKDIIWSQNGEFKLSSDDKRLHFIQNIRDEAHRFAISFHKKQKLKEDKSISLLKRDGIGEATIKKLILYFGTFENIKNASFEELSKVIGKKKAKNIKRGQT
jgi:excinuclease ABC subunit C